jgi:hypothetical protein
MLNALTELTINPTIAAVAGVVVGALGREFAPKLRQAFEQRYIDPRKRHRQVLLNQAAWFEERAQKLTVFAIQLRREPEADKFRLALLVSRLDRTDSEWAMKHENIDFLVTAADEKTKACHENAAECQRYAEEVTRKMLWD